MPGVRRLSISRFFLRTSSAERAPLCFSSCPVLSWLLHSPTLHMGLHSWMRPAGALERLLLLPVPRVFSASILVSHQLEGRSCYLWRLSPKPSQTPGTGRKAREDFSAQSSLPRALGCHRTPANDLRVAGVLVVPLSCQIPTPCVSPAGVAQSTFPVQLRISGSAP